MARKLDFGDGIGRLKKTIAWPFDKKEIQEVLGHIERLKSLVSLAF
jgi:hypothetical protein